MMERVWRCGHKAIWVLVTSARQSQTALVRQELCAAGFSPIVVGQASSLPNR